jgi:hypothetical protein
MSRFPLLPVFILGLAFCSLFQSQHLFDLAIVGRKYTRRFPHPALLALNIVKQIQHLLAAFRRLDRFARRQPAQRRDRIVNPLAQHFFFQPGHDFGRHDDWLVWLGARPAFVLYTGLLYDMTQYRKSHVPFLPDHSPADWIAACGPR